MDNPSSPNNPNFPTRSTSPTHQLAPGFPHVQEVLGIPPTQQSIWFNGAWLKDYYRVRDYEITSGTELFLYKGIPIVVRTSIKPIHMLVDVTITVQSLKEDVYHEINACFPVERMKLWLGDVELVDDSFLSVYNIYEECELSLEII